MKGKWLAAFFAILFTVLVGIYLILSKQNREILLIWGTQDTEITREMIKDIRSFLPHLQFKPVEDVGHGIIFQQPGIINTLIIDFLMNS